MPLAKAAAVLLREHRACKHEHAKSVLHALIDRLCREASWSRFYVSRAAQREGDRRKLGDLSQYRWRDQATRMGDKGRRIFHWDHFVTVSSLRERLLALNPITEDGARAILRNASGGWILKEENARLDQLGYRSKRPNPRAAYRAAKIELIRAW
jgi:hypothetical protein